MRFYLVLLLWFAPALFGQNDRPCVFCKIVRGETEVSLVYRGEKVIAFLDHAPINPGHTLVIPIAHFESLEDAPPDVAREMMEVAQKIGKSFKSAGIKAEAFQLHMNNGRMLQYIRHAHLHVYPRFKGDFPGDSVVRLESQRDRVPRPELDQMAAELRAALDLNKVYADYYEERLKLLPWLATMAGDPRYNDQLPNTLTDEYRERQRAFYKKYTDKLTGFDREKLVPNEQLNYDTLMWDCQVGLAGLEFRTELLPINQFSCLPLFMAVWAGGTGAQPFKTPEDYDNWLKRLDGLEQWLRTAIDRMREGITNGYVLPKALTEKVIPQIAKLATGPAEKHSFYAPIDHMPATFSPADRERLTRAFAGMLDHKIIPAYSNLYAFLKANYLPASRDTSGISGIPHGKEYYDLQIRDYTTLDLTADQVHQLGLNEVKRIAAEMEKVKAETGFRGTLREFFDFVRSKKALMPFTEPEQVLVNFKAIHKRMEPSLERLFDVTPRTAFEIRRTEAFREKSAAAQYMAGSLDGARPGTFYVPIPDVKTYNASRDESLFLHEAIPGHHYQISLQRENGALPDFRRTSIHSAFAEGWALYCESLGKELGLYNDPYQYFGMLSGEMHRAIRLVVDTGLHAKGWTREQAIAYSLENEAESESSVISEVERYMAAPGQALSYKIGQLKILELRARAEQALGADFDIRDFHHQVLETGSVPLKVLEAKINRWIAEKKN